MSEIIDYKMPQTTMRNLLSICVCISAIFGSSLSLNCSDAKKEQLQLLKALQIRGADHRFPETGYLSFFNDPNTLMRYKHYSMRVPKLKAREIGVEASDFINEVASEEFKSLTKSKDQLDTLVHRYFVDSKEYVELTRLYEKNKRREQFKIFKSYLKTHVRLLAEVMKRLENDNKFSTAFNSRSEQIAKNANKKDWPETKCYKVDNLNYMVLQNKVYTDLGSTPFLKQFRQFGLADRLKIYVKLVDELIQFHKSNFVHCMIRPQAFISRDSAFTRIELTDFEFAIQNTEGNLCHLQSDIRVPHNQMTGLHPLDSVERQKDDVAGLARTIADFELDVLALHYKPYLPKFADAIPSLGIKLRSDRRKQNMKYWWSLFEDLIRKMQDDFYQIRPKTIEVRACLLGLLETLDLIGKYSCEKFKSVTNKKLKDYVQEASNEPIVIQSKMDMLLLRV